MPQEELETLWKTALEQVKLSVSRGTYAAYFSSSVLKSIKTVDDQRQIAEVALANAFLRENVEQRYWSIVKQAIDAVTGKKNDLVFSVDAIDVNKRKGKAFAEPKENEESDREGLFNDTSSLQIESRAKRANLRPDFTFDNFAVSSSNQMAWAAASAVAKSPGNTYNPLFFYGGVGVGKTHLMQAIGHSILEKNPSAKIIYCAGEEFTNELVDSIKNNTTAKFKERYRTVNALFLDDVQFIGGKEKAQEEFFHTFNVILRTGGQVVLTSDRTPQEILIDDRLRTRLEAGLVIDVPQPDLELRAAILIIKARQKKLSFPDSLAPMVAEVITHPRQLEGFLVKVQNELTVHPREIDKEFIGELLGKQIGEMKTNRLVSPQDVINMVSNYFQVSVSQIKGDRRSQPLARQRQMLMFILKTELKLPLTEIGRILGDRDHTTVMHAVDKIGDGISSDAQTQRDLGAIKKLIYGTEMN